MSATLYATRDVNVRSGPSKDFEVIGWYSSGAKVTVTGQCNETDWYQVKLLLTS